MSKNLLSILAINPGSRYLGMAVFYGADLKDWRMKNISGLDVSQRMKKGKSIVLQYIDQYCPDILVMKRLHRSRSSPYLNRLATGIKQLARRKRVKVFQYSIGEMKAFFTGKKRSNRQELAEILVSKYPVLIPEFKKERENASPYYMRMFEAVALGAICSHRSG